MADYRGRKSTCDMEYFGSDSQDPDRKNARYFSRIEINCG
jgi:hypothetical protein